MGTFQSTPADTQYVVDYLFPAELTSAREMRRLTLPWGGCIPAPWGGAVWSLRW
jgi:hypothetical protein